MHFQILEMKGKLAKLLEFFYLWIMCTNVAIHLELGGVSWFIVSSWQQNNSIQAFKKRNILYFSYLRPPGF